MSKTGVLSDEECDVQVIEPLGLLGCLVIIEKEREPVYNQEGEIIYSKSESSSSRWPPSNYSVKHTHGLVVKSMVKLVSQVHKRLCRGIYTLD